jgi:hypothetical protein
MIVSVGHDGAVALDDPENFRAFKLVSATPDAAALAAALSGIGRIDGAHAWIDETWLRAKGADYGAGWEAEFDTMLAFAQSKGWVENGAIRAHIEQAGG